MHKALLKNLLLLLQFLIYLQSAASSEDEDRSDFDQNSTNSMIMTNKTNNFSIYCISNDRCPPFSVCLNNRCQCLLETEIGRANNQGQIGTCPCTANWHCLLAIENSQCNSDKGICTCSDGFQYNFTSRSCRSTSPTGSLNISSSHATAIHIETFEIVQTIVLIALPFIAILCLFFFCDRLGRYVQKMQTDITADDDSRHCGARPVTEVFVYDHHQHHLSPHQNQHITNVNNVTSNSSSVADLPPPYSNTAVLQNCSHVQFLSTKPAHYS